MESLNETIMREYFGLHGISKRLSDEVRTLIRSTVPVKPSRVKLDAFSKVIIKRIRSTIPQNNEAVNAIIRNASMYTPTHPNIYLIYALDQLVNDKNTFLNELDIQHTRKAYWPSYILVGIAMLVIATLIALVVTTWWLAAKPITIAVERYKQHNTLRTQDGKD